MSYYMMGIKFWSEVSLFLGLLPLLAVSARGLARVFTRAFSSNTRAPATLEPHRRGVLGASCRRSNAR